MNPGVHKQLYGVAILRLSLSAISLWVSSSLGLPCLVLQPKSWVSSCLILPCISMSALGAKRQMDRERTKKQRRFISYFRDHSSTNWTGRFPPSFDFCGHPLHFRQDGLCLFLHHFLNMRNPQTEPSCMTVRRCTAPSLWEFYHINYAVSGNPWNWAVDNL